MVDFALPQEGSRWQATGADGRAGRGRACRRRGPATRYGGRLERGPTFYEYFHGDTGRGLGASHQAGWTALVAHLIRQLGPTLVHG